MRLAVTQGGERANSDQAGGRDPSVAFALALAAISFIGPLAVHAYLPVMPAVRDAFALSEAASQLNFSISLFVMAFATLIYGSVSDRYGRRPALIAGLALFVGGTALCLIATTSSMLLAGRFVQAAGAGCGITLVRTIARDAYGAERLVKAIAYLTMAYTVGPMIAPAAGGFLEEYFGWRGVFAFTLASGVLIALAALSLIGETRPRGQAMTTSFRGMYRGYVELFSNWRFCAFVFQSGFNTAVFFTMAAASSVLMKDALNRPASEYGLYFLAFPVGYFTGNWISTRMSGKVSNEAMVLTGSILALATNLAQSAFLLAGVLNPAVLFIPALTITIAQGLSLPYAQAGAISIIPRLTGTASGIGAFLQSFLGAIATQIFGLLYDGSALPLVWVTMTGAVLVIFIGIAAWMGRPVRS